MRRNWYLCLYAEWLVYREAQFMQMLWESVKLISATVFPFIPVIRVWGPPIQATQPIVKRRHVPITAQSSESWEIKVRLRLRATLLLFCVAVVLQCCCAVMLSDKLPSLKPVSHDLHKQIVNVLAAAHLCATTKHLLFTQTQSADCTARAEAEKGKPSRFYSTSPRLILCLS